MYIKKLTHSLFGAWLFLLVHIQFTPSEGPKTFKTNFLRSPTMEVGPWTRTIEKGPLPWSDFIVHSVNQPSYTYDEIKFPQDILANRVRSLVLLSLNLLPSNTPIINENLPTTWINLLRAPPTHEPRAVTMKLWEPKRKCSKAVPTHLQNHVVWSRTLKCSVKSYVTEPSTKIYFNEFLFMQALTHDKNKTNQRMWVFGVPWSPDFVLGLLPRDSLEQ